MIFDWKGNTESTGVKEWLKRGDLKKITKSTRIINLTFTIVRDINKIILVYIIQV